MSTKHYTHGTTLTEGAWLTPLPALLTVRFCRQLLHTTGRSVSPGQLTPSSVSVGLVHCNTEWTRVVRDVSRAL